MWSLAGNQAVDQPIQQLCSWDVQVADPAALCLGGQSSRPGLESLVWAGRPGTESRGTRVEVLGLWVEQLASAPDALPPEVSGVGAPPGFHVWAPSSLICVRNQGSRERWAAYPALALQGWRGEGRQGPWLLPRVLQPAPECLYFPFLPEKFFLFKPPWSNQAPGCLQLSLALSQDSCSSPCAWAGASAALVQLRSQVQGPYCP